MAILLPLICNTNHIAIGCNTCKHLQQELCGALDAMTERGAASSLLALLPKDFTTTDLIRLRARKNQSVTPTSINSLLCRWRKLGRIDKTADAHWHRLT